MDYTNFEYILLDEEGRDLQRASKKRIEFSKGQACKIGDIGILDLGAFEYNNRKQLCEYEVLRLEQDNKNPWKYTVYIKKLDTKDNFELNTEIDRDGLDGWLNLGLPVE